MIGIERNLYTDWRLCMIHQKININEQNFHTIITPSLTQPSHSLSQHTRYTLSICLECVEVWWNCESVKVLNVNQSHNPTSSFNMFVTRVPTNHNHTSHFTHVPSILSRRLPFFFFFYRIYCLLFNYIFLNSAYFC